MKRFAKFSLVLLLQVIFAASMLASSANASKGSKGSGDKGSTSVSCSDKGSKGSSDKGSKGSSDKGSKSKNEKGSKDKGSKDTKGSRDKGSKGSSDNDCEPQPPVCDDDSDKGSKGSSDKGSKGSSDKGSNNKKGSKNKKGIEDKGSKGSSDKGSKGSKGSSDNDDDPCVTTVERDFGDALGYGDASHLIVPNGPFIGAVAPDAEAGTPLTSTDEATNIADEGDYVVAAIYETQLNCGGTYTVGGLQLILHVAVSGGGMNTLTGWIDWGNDGVFDASDEFFTDNTGSTFISAPVSDYGNAPASGANYPTYMRLRYSSQYIGPYGEAADGEVEDCQIFIVSPI